MKTHHLRFFFGRSYADEALFPAQKFMETISYQARFWLAKRKSAKSPTA